MSALPSDPTSRLLFDSLARYQPGADSGGNLRHNQVYELLAALDPGIAYTDLDTSGKSRLRGSMLAMRHLAANVLRRGVFSLRPKSLVQLGYGGKIWDCLSKSLQAHPDARCLINDSVARWPVAFFAPHHGLPWIALPQNLEVLWSGRDVLLHRTFWKGVEFEVDVLRRADAVFAISYEEQYILAQLNVPADVLPYYPPADQLAWLTRIRERRAQENGNHPRSILMLGTTTYRPTRDGLLKLLDRLAPLISDDSGLRIVVAGKGSESLRAGMPKFVELRGTVSQDDLFRLLSETSALLVHQDYGGGALTRIPDSLLAGIPVLANSVAARSARHHAGVHVYGDAAELRALMDADLPVPPVPLRPVAAERRLAATVRKFIAGSGLA